MGHLGRVLCTVHSISAHTNKEEIECTKAIDWLKSYCLIYTPCWTPSFFSDLDFRTSYHGIVFLTRIVKKFFNTQLFNYWVLYLIWILFTFLFVMVWQNFFSIWELKFHAPKFINPESNQGMFAKVIICLLRTTSSKIELIVDRIISLMILHLKALTS